jgi:predicted AAA+ superfamily ATPase
MAETFSDFIRLCAGRIGQTVNFSDMGAVLGVSFQTVRRWLSVLKQTFILYTLQPYFKNYKKRIVKSPKLYFYDTGLAAALMDIRSPEQLSVHFAKGGLFENFIINEVVKNHLNVGEKPRIYFWRQNERHEVDLLIERGQKLYPVEIKSGRTIKISFFDGLEHFEKITTDPIGEKFLIYGGKEKQTRSHATVLGWNALGNEKYDVFWGD